MSLKEPTGMSECSYFTNRSIGKGKIKAWVLKTICEKCHKGLMGKPVDQKTKKPKLRSEVYMCNNCGNSVNKKEYEETLTASVQYTCPNCSFSGETQIPFKRKKVKIKAEDLADEDSSAPTKDKTVDSLRFTCEKCGKYIDITKKMK